MAIIGDNAADVTWEIEQGTDIALGFALQTATGTVLDCTGYTAIMEVRATYAGPVLLEASTATRPDGTTGNGRITVGLFGTAPNQYSLQVAIAHGVTLALTDWGLGVWDLLVADTAGNRKRLAAGPAVLSQKVSG